jgi:hypothetical protein
MVFLPYTFLLFILPRRHHELSIEVIGKKVDEVFGYPMLQVKSEGPLWLFIASMSSSVRNFFSRLCLYFPFFFRHGVSFSSVYQTIYTGL